MRSLHNSFGSLSRWTSISLVAASLALGCGDKTTTTTSASASASSSAAPPETIAAVALADLVAPPEVVLFGSVEDVGKIADPLSTMAALISPGAAQLKSQLPKMASETLGLSSADALQLDKPVRIVVLDPKQHVRGFGVFLIHIKDEASLIATAPTAHTQSDQGNAYGWDIQGGRVYVNIVGNVAIFSMEPGVWAADQKFLKELSVATAPEGATFIAHGANVVSLYGADFDKALAAMKEQEEKLPEAQGRAIENIVTVDQGLLAALKDLDTLTISLRPTDDGLVLKYTVKPRAGTSLETTLKSLKPKGDNPLLARFPKASAAYLAASLSPDSMSAMQTTMKWILSLSLPPDQAERFMGSWSQLVAASTGDFVIGGFAGKDGLVVGGMSGIKDPDQAKAAQTAMMKMYDDASMKAALDKAGVKTTVKEKAYKIDDIDVTVTKSDLKTVPPGPIGAALNTFLETHSGIGKDAAFLAYGPNAKMTLTTLIEGKSAKDAPELGLDQGPGVVRAKKNGAANTILQAFVSPVALAGGGGDGSGIVLTLGAKDGVVELALDVPSSQVGPIMMGLSALRGFGTGAPAPSASAAPATKPPAPPKLSPNH